MQPVEFSLERFRLLVDRCRDVPVASADQHELAEFLYMHADRLLEACEACDAAARSTETLPPPAASLRFEYSGTLGEVKPVKWHASGEWLRCWVWMHADAAHEPSSNQYEHLLALYLRPHEFEGLVPGAPVFAKLTLEIRKGVPT